MKIFPRRSPEQMMSAAGSPTSRPVVGRGFMATFGLDPRVAMLTVQP
jgi:hypothetical protein